MGDAENPRFETARLQDVKANAPPSKQRACRGRHITIIPRNTRNKSVMSGLKTFRMILISRPIEMKKTFKHFSELSAQFIQGIESIQREPPALGRNTERRSLPCSIANRRARGRSSWNL